MTPPVPPPVIRPPIPWPRVRRAGLLLLAGLTAGLLAVGGPVAVLCAVGGYGLGAGLWALHDRWRWRFAWRHAWVMGRWWPLAVTCLAADRWRRR